MIDPRKQDIIQLTPDKWLELVETNDSENLSAILAQQHGADIAAIIEQLSFDFQRHILDLLADDQLAAEVIAELDGTDQARLIEYLPDERVIKIASYLSSDDATDMLGQIDIEQAQAILSHLPKRKQRHVSELLKYDDETAGGIMAKEVFAAPVTATVGEVIERLRSSTWKEEDIFNVYIVDDNNRLVGSISLKDIIIALPNQIVTEIMDDKLNKVHVGMDQEDVVGMFMRYDLVSAPVVNDVGHFIGRITHDDILEVYAEEADEDIARMTGQKEIDPGERSLFRNIRYRLPWLLLGLLGGIIAAIVIANFEGQLTKITSLVFFLPLVAAMGGNAGIQTSSVMVRGLATGEIGSYGLIARLFREFAISLSTGMICGFAIFVISWVWQNDLILASVVSCSLLFVIVFAAIVGAIIPLVLRRLGIDPALATGPFITTTNDIAGLFIYLALASLVLMK